VVRVDETDVLWRETSGKLAPPPPAGAGPQRANLPRVRDDMMQLCMLRELDGQGMVYTFTLCMNPAVSVAPCRAKRTSGF